MARDLIFNVHSLATDQNYDETAAKEWAVKLLDLFKMAQEQHIHCIRMGFGQDGCSKFTSVNIMKDYPFSQWLNEHVPAHARTLFLSWTVNKQVRIPAWIGLKELEERTNQRFCFDDRAWGLAFIRDNILTSLASHSNWDCTVLGCEYIDLEQEEEDFPTAYIRHACTDFHLKQHKRIYYCHPKHCYELPFTGRRGTLMDLDKAEAQQVLDRAVKIIGKKQLYGYSKRTRKLYEFQPENPTTERPFLGEQNKYHGYPIDPSEAHRKLDGRGYDDVIAMLKESGDIDDIAARKFIEY